MECILETKAAMILEFLAGLHGSLSVTFEEGTWAAWLHDLRKPHVRNLVVCDPRKNAGLKDGSKCDRSDARKLAEWSRGHQHSPVYHGEHGVRTMKELGRSYLTHQPGSGARQGAPACDDGPSSTIHKRPNRWGLEATQTDREGRY